MIHTLLLGHHHNSSSLAILFFLVNFQINSIFLLVTFLLLYLVLDRILNFCILFEELGEKQTQLVNFIYFNVLSHWHNFLIFRILILPIFEFLILFMSKLFPIFDGCLLFVSFCSSLQNRVNIPFNRLHGLRLVYEISELCYRVNDVHLDDRYNDADQIEV